MCGILFSVISVVNIRWTRTPGEPRESESVAEIGDLATILVNWLES